MNGMENLQMIMQLKGMWDRFTTDHSMFPKFMNAVMKQGIPEGSVIEISVTAPDGTPLSTNIKVSASDIELFETLKSLKP
jgi:hypothetical protein